MSLILIAAAILPVVLLAWFVYKQDKYDREPPRLLLRAFLLGVLSCFPAIVMEGFLQFFTPGIPVVDGIFNGFVVAGFSEELCKLLLLSLAIWRNSNFDEYFDGIIYSTFVALGFACFENFGYVLGQGSMAAALATSASRAVLSVPGHFLFGVAMGYFFALAKFDPKHRTTNLLKALLVPTLLHGTFDALLMIPESMADETMQSITSSVLFIVFIYFDVKLWKAGVKRIRHLQKLSSTQSVRSLDDIDWNM